MRCGRVDAVAYMKFWKEAGEAGKGEQPEGQTVEALASGALPTRGLSLHAGASKSHLLDYSAAAAVLSLQVSEALAHPTAFLTVVGRALRKQRLACHGGLSRFSRFTETKALPTEQRTGGCGARYESSRRSGLESTHFFSWPRTTVTVMQSGRHPVATLAYSYSRFYRSSWSPCRQRGRSVSVKQIYPHLPCYVLVLAPVAR